jgi:5'-3' exonuclease
MIPGKHYSWPISGKGWEKPGIYREVTPLEGMRWFYTQVLVGDTSDNIKGCPGIGKVKAERMLKDCETEEEMFEAVRNAYSFDEALLMNGQVLWIQRQPNQIWEFPIDTTEREE